MAAVPVPAAAVKRAVGAIQDANPRMRTVRFSSGSLKLAETCLGELVALLTAEAQERVDAQRGRTLGAEHVLGAVRGLEFDEFVRPLEDALESFRVVEAAEREVKRRRKQNRDTLPEGMSEKDVEDMQNELFSSARQRMGFTVAKPTGH